MGRGLGRVPMTDRQTRLKTLLFRNFVGWVVKIFIVFEHVGYTFYLVFITQCRTVNITDHSWSYTSQILNVISDD